MKIIFFNFFVLSFWAECVPAQDHIQVKEESIIKDGKKNIAITITNTSDKEMQIWCRWPSQHSSYFNIRFLDNNDQIVFQRYELGLIRDYEKEMKMLIVKPHSSEKLDHYFLLGDLQKYAREKYDSIKWFIVTYSISYRLSDKDSSVLWRYDYRMTSDRIAF